MGNRLVHLEFRALNLAEYENASCDEYLRLETTRANTGGNELSFVNTEPDRLVLDQLKEPEAESTCANIYEPDRLISLLTQWRGSYLWQLREISKRATLTDPSPWRPWLERKMFIDLHRCHYSKCATPTEQIDMTLSALREADREWTQAFAVLNHPVPPLNNAFCVKHSDEAPSVLTTDDEPQTVCSAISTPHELTLQLNMWASTYMSEIHGIVRARTSPDSTDIWRRWCSRKLYIDTHFTHYSECAPEELTREILLFELFNANETWTESFCNLFEYTLIPEKALQTPKKKKKKSKSRRRKQPLSTHSILDDDDDDVDDDTQMLEVKPRVLDKWRVTRANGEQYTTTNGTLRENLT